MSMAEFFAMKGYGLYVWGSYGIALLLLAAEIIAVRHRRKIALRQVKMMREQEIRE